MKIESIGPVLLDRSGSTRDRPDPTVKSDTNSNALSVRHLAPSSGYTNAYAVIYQVAPADTIYRQRRLASLLTADMRAGRTRRDEEEED